MLFGLSTDQLVKITLAVIALIGGIIAAVFSINKRSHKVGNINGNNNTIHNGDTTKKGK